MSGLRKVQIKDLGRVVTGHTPPTGDREFYGDKWPLIKPTDMRLGERYIGVTEESLSLVGFKKFESYLLPPDTPCVVTIGTIGKLCITKEPSFCNQAVNAILVETSKHDPMYVYYLMRFTNPRVKALSSGTTSGRENVSKGVFESIEVNVHSLPEQRRIGAVLATYDDLIENNTRRIKILEQMAQMLYREWFVYFRFPGDEKVKLVESELGKIPYGWQISRLGTVTTKIGSGATPRGGKESYQKQGISLIRSLNVYDYRFEMADLAFIDEEQAKQLDNVTVETNDVLLNITGASVGRCVIVPTCLLPARVNQHVSIIRANPTKIDPFFLLDTINHDRNKRRLLGVAQGGATREALTKGTLTEFPILLPPFDLIRKYGEIAGTIHNQRENLSHKNENLRTTRDLLLPKLVSGEIEVPQAEQAVEAVTA